MARAAFGLVAELAGKAQLDTLRKSLASAAPSVRVAAAEALRRFGDDSGLLPVLDVLKEGTVTERREAVKVLGGFRVRGAIPRLIDALEDPDASVRSYAWSGVRQVIVALFPYRRLDWVGMGTPYNAGTKTEP